MEHVPCEFAETEQCPVFVREGECYEDRHHEFWPNPDYTTPVEKRFRELDINKKFICRAIHNARHAEAPPIKPSRDVMLGAINAEKEKRKAA